ncbi:polyisoprenoid-binding protein YceI [Kitasatospora sp. MAA4]|uniref:YceI family protein n=1 Tax=Kitasatospora sp. MAA4 TaxID=3035093 RepID=UPI0024760686|nr:YceI family protein [Kitasatospora sp. MAA4]MDH6137759.1 polyisoprenoid-binding protein YceI [Kitasatospora sp. MAA4]
MTSSLTDLAPGSWVLDPAGSAVRFRHSAMWGLATVKGEFARIEGHGELPAGGGPAHGRIAIDAASLDTRNARRDTHLRSADFFDVQAHPQLVFDAQSVTASGADTAAIKGTLTVRGTTKPLSFTAHATEATADAVTLAAEVKVDRADFGLTWNKAGVIKGPATISISARFTRRLHPS